MVLCFFRRRPAWTDRILYTVQKDNYANVTLDLDQKSYKCHPGYNISDHKPVTSEFIMTVSNSSYIILFIVLSLQEHMWVQLKFSRSHLVSIHS